MYADSMSNVCDPVYVHCILYLSISCKNSLWCNLFCFFKNGVIYFVIYFPHDYCASIIYQDLLLEQLAELKKKTEDEASPRIFMALLFQVIS